MPGRYSVLYRRTREALEAEAETKLERPLTIREQNLFRSCGTLTMLETLGMTVYYAEDAQDLANKLAETSMDSRFILAVRETAEHLEHILGRTLAPDEQQKLRALGNIEALWYLQEQLQEVASEEREGHLRLLLEEPPLTAL